MPFTNIPLQKKVVASNQPATDPSPLDEIRSLQSEELIKTLDQMREELIGRQAKIGPNPPHKSRTSAELSANLALINDPTTAKAITLPSGQPLIIHTEINEFFDISENFFKYLPSDRAAINVIMGLYSSCSLPLPESAATNAQVSKSRIFLSFRGINNSTHTKILNFQKIHYIGPKNPSEHEKLVEKILTLEIILTIVPRRQIDKLSLKSMAEVIKSPEFQNLEKYFQDYFSNGQNPEIFQWALNILSRADQSLPQAQLLASSLLTSEHFFNNPQKYEELSERITEITSRTKRCETVRIKEKWIKTQFPLLDIPKLFRTSLLKSVLSNPSHNTGDIEIVTPTQTFRAHSAILSRFSYYNALLSSNYTEAKSKKIEWAFCHSAESAELLLRFIYTGEVSPISGPLLDLIELPKFLPEDEFTDIIDAIKVAWIEKNSVGDIFSPKVLKNRLTIIQDAMLGTEDKNEGDICTYLSQTLKYANDHFDENSREMLSNFISQLSDLLAQENPNEIIQIMNAPFLKVIHHLLEALRLMATSNENKNLAKFAQNQMESISSNLKQFLKRAFLVFNKELGNLIDDPKPFLDSAIKPIGLCWSNTKLDQMELQSLATQVLTTIPRNWVESAKDYAGKKEKLTVILKFFGEVAISLGLQPCTLIFHGILEADNDQESFWSQMYASALADCPSFEGIDYEFLKTFGISRPPKPKTIEELGQLIGAIDRYGQTKQVELDNTSPRWQLKQQKRKILDKVTMLWDCMNLARFHPIMDRIVDVTMTLCKEAQLTGFRGKECLVIEGKNSPNMFYRTVLPGKLVECQELMKSQPTFTPKFLPQNSHYKWEDFRKCLGSKKN